MLNRRIEILILDGYLLHRVERRGRCPRMSRASLKWHFKRRRIVEVKYTHLTRTSSFESNGVFPEHPDKHSPVKAPRGVAVSPGLPLAAEETASTTMAQHLLAGFIMNASLCLHSWHGICCLDLRALLEAFRISEFALFLHRCTALLLELPLQFVSFLVCKFQRRFSCGACQAWRLLFSFDLVGVTV